MTKCLRKEKINYLRGAKTYLDNTISFDNINSNNNNNNISNNNNINTTLTNISNQLKNVAIVDKNKEFKLLNSSFRKKYKNIKNNKLSNNLNNNLINSSLNIDNNQNQNKSNFLDITNSEIHPKFQNLQKSKVLDFFIFNKINVENINYEEIKKENIDLKENIKFLLKQIKKYQKSGLTIEDMNLNRQQELENLEKKINVLNEQINSYKKKILLLDNNNNKLIKENNELRNYINIKLEEEKQYEINNNKTRNKEFNGIQNKQETEQFYDIGGFDEKNLEYNNLKMFYNKKVKSIIDNDNINSNNSKLSEELLADNISDLYNPKNKKHFLYLKEYSNHVNRFGNQRSGFSEGKLYFRKNIGKRYLSFNEEPYNKKKYSSNNFTYSKNYLNNNNSFKK